MAEPLREFTRFIWCIVNKQRDKQSDEYISQQTHTKTNKNSIPPCWIDSSGWKLTIKLNSSNTTKNYFLKVDLYQRPSPEEAGTQFFRFLTVDTTGIRRVTALTDHATKENHQLVPSDGDRQRATAFYQVDQRGHTHPKGRTTGHEPWWGQLPTEPRIRPLSWHGVFSSCQEPEELSTSFFWWRPLIEVERSRFRWLIFGCVWWI